MCVFEHFTRFVVAELKQLINISMIKLLIKSVSLNLFCGRYFSSLVK